MSTRILSLALAAAAVVGCRDSAGHAGSTATILDPPVATPSAFVASVVVLSDTGDPIAPDLSFATDAGDANIESISAAQFQITGLRQPALVRVEATGHFDDLVVIDRESLTTTITLLAETGPGGERRAVLHFAGDAMMARRYITPTSPTTAILVPGDGGASARDIVSAVAPLFAAADMRSLNLETVVGNLPDSAAYPRKRFLLQSPPEVLAALDELDANVVTLGNNHVRDWLEQGVVDTLANLDTGGFPHVGAGIDEASAAAPLIQNIGGYQIGTLSYTSVNGDFVNDSLPLDSDPVPPNLPPDESWQYEFRSFGFVGTTVSIPTASRRIGEVWTLIEDAEDPPLSEVERAALWSAATVVYPELQDWVARRGHDGANYLEGDRMEQEIDDLRTAGCDLIVVQFHSGFQFASFKSQFTESSAHQAIDAGADLVIAHHPHVLQGFEVYDGRLIVYSLGNFIFDQDFLATFATAIVRVVFEETSLLEARVYPLVLDNYRPVPLGGAAAKNVIQTLHERSALEFRSARVGGLPRNVASPLAANAEAPHFRFERNTARIVFPAPPTQTLDVDVDDTFPTDLPGPKLTRSRGPGGTALTNLLFGRDVFQWGTFEDLGADGDSRGGIQWAANEPQKRIEVLESAPSGVRCLRLRRAASNTASVLARPVARIPLPRHRLYSESGGVATPLDGTPSYSLRFRARLSGSAAPFVRFDVFHFDDSNPTADPNSLLLRRRDLDLTIPADDLWHEIVFDIPASVLADAGPFEANAVLLYMGLAPAGEFSVLLVDDVQVIEWRAAADLPDGFHDVDVLRSAVPGTLPLTLERTGD